MKLIEFESKEQRYKTIEGIYHSLDKPKVYRIRKKCKELGFKPPHKKTVKRILAELETESVKEPVVEPTAKDKPVVKAKPTYSNKPRCNDNEEIPKDYVILNGSYSCPNCYKSFSGSQIVRSEGKVFTVTKYKELHMECPFCQFTLGTLSDFKKAWERRNSGKPKVVETAKEELTTECNCGRKYMLTANPNQSITCLQCGCEYDRKNRIWRSLK